MEIGASTGGDSSDDHETIGQVPAIATFEVAGGEQFKVELNTQELVDHAQQLLDGAIISAIPLGTVVRDDPDVHAPWSGHLDPETFSFAFATTEVCDGIPSFVEDETVTSLVDFVGCSTPARFRTVDERVPVRVAGARSK